MVSPSANLTASPGPRATTTPLPSPLRQSAAQGLWLGLCGGIGTACADFFAQWLWLDGGAQRASLLVTLVTLEGAIGAGLGAVMALLYGLGLRAAAKHLPSPLQQPLVLLCLLGPAAVALGHSLLQGARLASTIAPALLYVILLTSSAGLALLIARVQDPVHHLLWRERGWAVSGAFLGCAAVSKLDQHLYPSLYEGLHLALTLLAGLLAAACGLYLGVHQLASRRLATGLVILSMPLGLVVGYQTANGTQNVRVAVLQPRASHAHSLTHALRGWLRQADTISARRSALQVRSSTRVASPAKQAPRKAPVLPTAHVLVITVDALRADRLGSYGGPPGLSPQMDRLAAQAVRFERAYTPAPHTSFALGSLFTSRVLPPTGDLTGPLPQQTLPTLLRAAGYHTAAFFTHGIFHTGYDRLGQYAESHFGFDRYDDNLSDSDEVTRAALAEMDRTRERGEPASFFWVHYFDVHEPYRDRRYGDSPEARYNGEVSHVDGAIGALLAGMEKRLTRNTVVVLTADHGEAFQEHGQVFHGSSLYDEQISVPLIVQAPGLVPHGEAGPAQLIDVGPTILGLLGLPRGPEMGGRDLLDEGPSRSAFAMVNEQAALVTPPYKLIMDLRFGSTELYDLAQDPGERNNLADRRSAVVAHMLEELDTKLATLRATEQGPAGALAQARLGDRRALPSLRDLVQCVDCALAERIEAVQGLSDLGGDKDRALLHRLSQRHDALAPHATVGAGLLGEASSAKKLDGLLATSTITRLIADLRGVPLPKPFDAAMALAALGKREAVPHLISALPELRAAHRERDERRAIAALGRLRDSRSLEALAERVLDPYVGYAAVLALGELGDARALEPLLLALRDGPANDIRDNAALALGQLGDPRAIPALRAADPDRVDPTYLSASLQRLSAIGDRVGAAPALDHAMKRHDPSTGRHRP